MKTRTIEQTAVVNANPQGIYGEVVRSKKAQYSSPD